MIKKDSVLLIDNFTLTSSSEVDGVVREIVRLRNTNLLIHVASFIHNTVLVQNLKSQLEKNIPTAKIVMLKHNDKSKTTLVAYDIGGKINNDYISDEILLELQHSNIDKDIKLNKCKKQLISKYFTDHLTSFSNLYQLRSDLQDVEEFVLITVAIDNFALYNNYYGFLTGDYMIEQIGEFLTKNIDEKIYRISGTEFSIYIDRNFEFYELKDYLSLLYEKIKNLSIRYQNTEISVGFTLASCASNMNENVFSKVSMALKYAKDKRLPFWIYENRMGFENEYEKNLSISNEIIYAVKNNKIIPYYQAIIDNKTSKIDRYECLARLIDSSNNVIAPELFIPISKRIKAYDEVTKTIVEKSFTLFEQNDYNFSINLSMEDIINGDIFDFITDKLKSSNASRRVTFEIVESEAIKDFEKVMRFIKEVRRYGAKIAIDDFGDGYSNFSYLIKMDVDFLKIDGSLIENIDTDKNSLFVVETIIDFAKKLGIKTIAEYVHSSTVMDKVMDMGIDYSQGFYIDKPSLELEERG